MSSYFRGFLALSLSYLLVIKARESEDEMIGIYKIENIVNNKVYIGQSIDIYTRWYNHRSELNGNRHHNEHLQNAWNKYKENNFTFTIIEECRIEELDNKEIYWIEYYNAFDSQYGYNMTLGGQGNHGYSWNDEDKERLSKIHNPNSVLQIDLKGNIVERWRSGSYAARETGYPISGIMNCVRDDGDQYQAHGYIWLYEEVFNDKNFNIQEYISNHIKEKERIFQYDLYGTLVKVWNNTSEIIACFGLGSKEYKTIFKCIKHITKSYNGYIYLFENDNAILNDDYLRRCRIDCYRYKINQFSVSNKNFIKTWTIEELKNSKFNFNTIRVCCTNNLFGHKVNGTAFSYIWEYE